MDELFDSTQSNTGVVSFSAESLQAAETEMKAAFAAVPPGKYVAYISKFTFQEKPEKSYRGFSWQFKIVSDDPMVNNKVVFHNTPVQRMDSATGVVSAGDDVTRWLRYLILAAVGTPEISPDAYNDGSIQITDEVFLNRMVKITVVHNPNPMDAEKPFVNIKFIEAYDEHGKRYDGSVSGNVGSELSF